MNTKREVMQLAVKYRNQGMSRKEALRKAWGSGRNPGAAWHAEQANLYYNLQEKEDPGSWKYYKQGGRASAHDTSESASKVLGIPNPGMPSQIRCNECGKVFKRVIGPRTYEIKCPKCGGYDTEPAEFFAARKNPGAAWHHDRYEEHLKKYEHAPLGEGNDDLMEARFHRKSERESDRYGIPNPTRADKERVRDRNPGQSYHLRRAEKFRGFQDRSIGRGDIHLANEYGLRANDQEMDAEESSSQGLRNPSEGLKKFFPYLVVGGLVFWMWKNNQQPAPQVTGQKLGGSSQ